MISIRTVLASASALVLASTAMPAQAAQPVGAAAASETALGEIVVTARRRSESLQEVPQVVNAIGAETLAKLQIRDFRDIQTVAPGVSLQHNTNGTSSSATMRGVSFDAKTSAQPTVALYLNDVPVEANFLFNTLFDVGQVEVLRGPQGTNRGISAPSGAITVTTRRPDLSEFGGYIDVTATDLQARNVNGAINVPVIRDVLGVRIAAVMDQDTFDGVRSIYSKLRPRVWNAGVRASISFEPSDAFNANLVYQHLDRTMEFFVPVTGPGFPGLTPPIAPLDRVSAQEFPTTLHKHYDTLTLALDGRLWGQHLSYLGSYQNQHFINNEDRDSGNILPGVPNTSILNSDREDTTHEIRIASDPAPGRFFDYVGGVFYQWTESGGHQTYPGTYNLGAFGPSATAPNLPAYNPIFQTPTYIPTVQFREETSLFGSVTLHLGSKTELTGGLRHLWTRFSSHLMVYTGLPLTSTQTCAQAALPPGLVPGTCIARVSARPPKSYFREEHTIYNVSLSHRFTPDLMVYGNVGTSFRPPFASTGIQNAGNNPVLNELQVHPSEKSRSIELGVKWTFLEDRGRLNAAIFKQKYRNLPIYVTNVPYVANTGSVILVLPSNLTAHPDAVIEGFDVDAAFQVTPNWSVSGQVSYADGRATGEMPCNDSNFDGRPDNGQLTSVSQFPPGVLVGLCTGGSVSQQPYWSATLQSEYVHAVGEAMDAYVRGLFTYFPENARATPATVIDNYGLASIFAGVRASDGAWDAGLFVRNAFNTRKLTYVSATQPTDPAAALSVYRSLNHLPGYFTKTLTPRREVGINVRYAFGTR